MSDNYLGKDGLERNQARHKYEWKLYRRYMKTQPQSHAPFLNALVEMCRVTPWLAGHIWLYTLIALGGGVAGGIWLW